MVGLHACPADPRGFAGTRTRTRARPGGVRRDVQRHGPQPSRDGRQRPVRGKARAGHVGGLPRPRRRPMRRRSRRATWTPWRPPRPQRLARRAGRAGAAETLARIALAQSAHLASQDWRTFTAGKVRFLPACGSGSMSPGAQTESRRSEPELHRPLGVDRIGARGLESGGGERPRSTRRSPSASWSPGYLAALRVHAGAAHRRHGRGARPSPRAE